MVYLSAYQSQGLKKQSSFIGALPNGIQQDSVFAGISTNAVKTPEEMIQLIHKIEEDLVRETLTGSFKEDFDTAATINSVQSDGNGQISVVNGTVGDTLTHIYVVDRNKGTVEIISQNVQNGQLWLGEAFSWKTDQNVDNATNIYDVKLEDGQELHILSCSDGVPVYDSCDKLKKSDMPFHEKIGRYLLETPKDAINLAKKVTEIGIEAGSKDNISATSQTFHHDSPQGNYMTAVFDANGGKPADIELFRKSVEITFAQKMGEISYSKPVEISSANDSALQAIKLGNKTDFNAKRQSTPRAP